MYIVSSNVSSYSRVPDAFEYELIIPLVKDKSGGLVILGLILLVITKVLLFAPNISKLFECVLLTNCEHF